MEKTKKSRTERLIINSCKAIFYDRTYLEFDELSFANLNHNDYGFGYIEYEFGFKESFSNPYMKFYHCYLNKNLTDSVLTPAFESVVDAKLDLTEYRLSQIIFKLAVEMAYTMNILAGAFELEPEKLELMKDRVLYEVKSINGAINLIDIIKYQNGY